MSAHRCASVCLRVCVSERERDCVCVCVIAFDVIPSLHECLKVCVCVSACLRVSGDRESVCVPQVCVCVSVCLCIC